MAQNNDNRHGGNRPLPSTRDLVQPQARPEKVDATTIMGDIAIAAAQARVRDPDPLDQPVTLRQVLAAFEAVAKKTRGGIYRVPSEEIFQTIYESLRQA